MPGSPERAEAAIAEARNIHKTFGATRALAGVDLSVQPGEIHALLGENGAGKSTLAAILSGAQQPDRGELRLDGSSVNFASTRDALRHGVAIVHQELALMASLTVRQNLDLGFVALGSRDHGPDDEASPASGRPRLRRHRGDTRERVDALLEEFSLHQYAERRVGELPQAIRQVVEIARSLGLRTRLLILDEPTTALPPRERQDLYERLAVLKARGLAVVLITHMLDEALAVSDRITVLRDGKRVGTLAADDITVDRLIEMMTGRQLRAALQHRRATHSSGRSGRPMLEVDELLSPPLVKSVSFTIAEGEIIGLAGLIGSGRTETLEAIFGARTRNRDSVRFSGKPLPMSGAKASLHAGIALLPEDRQAAGLFSCLTVAENIAMGVVAARRGRWRTVLASGGMLRRQNLDTLGWELASEVDIVVRDMNLPITSLSGGNQQKALLGRLLATAPKVLLADEPTRGVSVGSRAQIYDLLRRLADGGMSICVASSDYDELVTLCDRIVVLVDGCSVQSMSVEAMAAEELLEIVLEANRDFTFLPSAALG